ncbi:hypothetical protein [Thermobifida halotolerans]|uniref:hypothetical protein n=1 Tax=Thermobifida halotolerans TaxID=483545 RepID=UPI001F3E450F|nr:hypothetical protein [Thermobifida halotolerans]
MFVRINTPAVGDRQRLEEVAAELDSRPRKALGWETPAERLAVASRSAVLRRPLEFAL